MHVVMFAIGGFVLFGAFVCLMAATGEYAPLKSMLYLYSAISMGLGGIMFLGFGTGLMLLQQLVENTKPLHELFANAKARMAQAEQPAPGAPPR
jgi:branched-subunit amino acid ABC-type transport system permease component